MSEPAPPPAGPPGPPANASVARSAAPRRTRRDFLARLGASVGASVGVLAAGCGDGATDPLAQTTVAPGAPEGGINLVYAHAQLMADFYARAAGSPFVGATNNYLGMTGVEVNALLGIGGHKNAHKNALAQLIPAGRITDILLFDFASVDYSSRAAVLGFALRMEEVGVAAVNGVLPTLADPTDATLVAKIAASWGRHAAVVRDLLDLTGGNANTAGRTGFAAATDAAGLDPVLDAAAVVAAIQPYIRTRLVLA